MSEIQSYPRHEYQKLQSPTSIRLLKLASLTKQSDEDVPQFSATWELVQEDLSEEHHPYVCISYTWGDSSIVWPVGLTDGTFIMVSQNAWEAIRRYTSTDDYMWIDQVCINQGDIDERNAQIGLTKEMYSQCTRCDAWLGSVDEYSDDALDLTAEIATSFPGSFLLAKLSPLNSQPHAYIRKVLEEHDPPVLIPATDDPRWLALARFLDRPWFSRLRTVQEAVIPKEVFFRCGTRAVKFLALWAAAILVGIGNPWEPKSLSAQLRLPIIVIIRDFFHGDMNEPFIHLLHRVRNGAFECFDQRDKVYALIGLSQSGMDLAIDIDYWLSLEALFTKVAVAVIDQAQSLHILSIKLDPLDFQLPHLPSWVPDWSGRFSCMPLESPHPEQLYFRADRRRQYCHKQNESALTRRKLVVAGRICDRVTSVCGWWFTDTGSQANRIAWVIYDAYPALKAILDRDSTSSLEEKRRKIFQTMTVNGFATQDFGYPTENWTSSVISEKLDAFFVNSEDFRNNQDEAFERLPSALQEWLRSLAIQITFCADRRFAELDRFKFGLFPRNIAQGDLVAILHGLSVPAVLRRAGDNYRYIGPAFIDGMMNGEACDWPEDAAEKFVLI